MEYIAANMIVMLKMNPSEYGSKLQGFPTAPQFAKCWSDVVCFFTGINYGIRPPKSPNCWILIGCRSREMMWADVSLKYTPGYYMKRTLSIMLCHTVSVTIPDLLTINREILLCSR